LTAADEPFKSRAWEMGNWITTHPHMQRICEQTGGDLRRDARPAASFRRPISRESAPWPLCGL